MPILNPNIDNFYLKYYRLGGTSYREKVRFYDENKEQLKYLSREEVVDVKLDYLLCLFEIGKYKRFLTSVDPLIETVVIENIYDYNGQDIFKALLFKKAASLYNSNLFVKAETVLKQLVAMDTENEDARALYWKCKRKQGSSFYEGAKAASIVCLLCFISLSFMEMLIVKPFYNNYLEMYSTLKVIMGVLCPLILIGNEFMLSYSIGKEIGLRFKSGSIIQKVWPF